VLCQERIAAVRGLTSSARRDAHGLREAALPEWTSSALPRIEKKEH